MMSPHIVYPRVMRAKRSAAIPIWFAQLTPRKEVV